MTEQKNGSCEIKSHNLWITASETGCTVINGSENNVVINNVPRKDYVININPNEFFMCEGIFYVLISSEGLCLPSKIKKVVGDFLKEKHGIIVKETHGSPSSSEVETCQWYVVSFSVQSGAKSVHVDICTESSEKPKACIELVCESMKTGGGNKRSRNKNVVSSFPSDLSVESLPSKKVKLDDIKLSLVREAGAGNVISINVVRVLDLNQENYINRADDPQVIQAGEQPLAESDYGGPSKAVDDQG